MNKAVKEKWLKELKSGNYKHVGHRLQCADMFCAMGVLCLIHGKETNHEFINGFYMNEYMKVPQEVLDWAELKADEESIVIIKNNEMEEGGARTYQEAIKYIEESL